MFADIAGFTNLTEQLSKIGAEGAEKIAFAINRYMELLIKNIGKCGGDIFKFAGGKYREEKKKGMQYLLGEFVV
jgi:adenylate cyclase 10